MTFDGFLKIPLREGNLADLRFDSKVDGRCRFVVSKIFLLGLCCFVFNNGTFSSLLLCLGTVLPLKDFERLDCIALHCIAPD